MKLTESPIYDIVWIFTILASVFFFGYHISKFLEKSIQPIINILGGVV